MAKRISRVAQLHADWIGMLQPEGLVVSNVVLEEAEIYVRKGPEVQAAFRAFTPDDVLSELAPLLDWLQWPKKFLVEDLERTRLDLPDLGATVQADAVLNSPKGESLALVSWCPGDLDDASGDPKWPTSPAERFERLLIDKSIPVGLQVSPHIIRLTYAPAGEAPGRFSFPVKALRASDGRILIDALVMLLGKHRMFLGPAEKRLLPLLQASRKRQETVTVKLAGQVEDALRILLAGFDAADAKTDGRVLREVANDDLYAGLTTVLLRLVFLLYAEDRGLLPTDNGVYVAHYSLAGLAEKLQEESVLYAGAMDARFGAWARLCTLFRMVFTGARHGGLHLPPRQGHLFDPQYYPFLEGRVTSNWRQDRGELPPVDDGVVAKVLHRLLHLEGQRISYQNLEVEQIGSVYESLMGFEIARAAGPCVETKPAGVVFELHGLREAAETDGIRWLADAIGDKPAKLKKKVPELAAFVPGEDVDADIATLRELVAPLQRKGSNVIPAGVHYLQPGEERRRSGSHYTPRSLTEPIVARTIGPVLDRKGPPTPEQILALKVCDPAMGSGAFLAEACRYLAKRLLEAWGRTGTTPQLALERKDPELYARRLIAENCLYGVDKNPRAVQLARLSMWLVTSARELPFTFVDHALKEGDALIGLDVEQIASFSFDRTSDAPLWLGYLRGAMQSAARTRAKINQRQREFLFASEHKENKTFLDMAEDEVWDERRVGDLVIACAWAGGSKTQVKKRIQRMAGFARAWYPSPDREPMPSEAQALLVGLPMRPFHWPLEFPEVFSPKKPGFDCLIGNPPFGGQESIRQGNGGAQYIKLLQTSWTGAHGNSDLSAYFFRRTATVLRGRGTFGLVATNTISQGNTRATGLQPLLADGVVLYHATTDLKWPVAGAAVVVSVIHGSQAGKHSAKTLNDQAVESIASDLSPGPELPDPVKLRARKGQSFAGSKIYGQGFVLTLEEAARHRINPDNHIIVRDYIGGRELNNNVPAHPTEPIPHERCVISFGDRAVAEAEAWPELLSIVREKVKPERDNNNRDHYRLNWWQHGERRPGLYRTISTLDRCLTCSLVTKHLLFSFQPTNRIFSHKLAVMAFDDWANFAVLQSTLHDAWAWDRSSTMKQDLNYTPSRCFETFPFPRPDADQQQALEASGEALYKHRAEVMVASQEGMTQVWNRVVDLDCIDPEIVELRRLRDAMDRAVLDAYGWSDLEPTDKDEILTRLRKLNAARAAEEKRKR